MKRYWHLIFTFWTVLPLVACGRPLPQQVEPARSIRGVHQLANVEHPLRMSQPRLEETPPRLLRHLPSRRVRR